MTFSEYHPVEVKSSPTLNEVVLAKIRHAYGVSTGLTITAALQDLWSAQPNAISLYLRGSIATNVWRGTPIDLDLYLIESMNRVSSVNIRELNFEFRQRYRGLPVLDISFVPFEALMDPNRRLMTRLILKSEGTRLIGADLKEGLPIDSLNEATARSLHFKQSLIVERKIVSLIKSGSATGPDEEFWKKYDLKSMAKATLRLAMPDFILHEQRFERGITACADHLLHQAPRLSDSIATLLDLIDEKEVAPDAALTSAIQIYGAVGFD